jgi:DNA-binding NarL/FixJ family response regulator
MHHGGSPMSPEIARRVVESMQKGKNKNIEILTGREKEILDLLSKGFIYKEIAKDLDISYETVKKHIQNIYEKLQVQNKVEALNKAYPK